MNLAITKIRKNCYPCLKRLASRPLEPLRTDTIPLVEQRPMNIVGLKFFTSGGCNYLICTDNLSGYTLCSDMADMTIDNTIRQCHLWFLQLGMLKTVKSDCGPSFQNRFTEWCTEAGIIHQLSSARNSSSNGLAKSGVKQVKRLLEKCRESGQSFIIALSQWMCSNRSRNNALPADVFYSRRVRGILPSLDLGSFDAPAAAVSREVVRQKHCTESEHHLKILTYSVGCHALIQNPVI
jgi:hypothetical protein